MTVHGTSQDATTVNIEMRELIQLMASEVARKVTDELRETEIVPLSKRLNDLELKLQAPSPNTITLAHWKGGFDALWKTLLIVASLAAIWKNLH